MVQPSPSLAARLRFTTKSVGRGFYRGNRVGSTGSHTKHGGYLIDWRKTTNYNVPDELATFKLTPYVTREINPKQEPDYDEQNGMEDNFSDFDDTTSNFAPVSILDQDSNEFKRDLLKHLTAWRRASPDEFATRLEDECRADPQKMRRLPAQLTELAETSSQQHTEELSDFSLEKPSITDQRVNAGKSGSDQPIRTSR